jgi:molybdopterin-containing oxidoreductase family iron-sulfur binding subunit
MKKNKPQYWKGLEELNKEASFEKARYNEFAEKLPIGEVIAEGDSLSSTRRDFLKLMGFSISAATLAACTRTPVKKIMPYVNQPADVTPGVANYYATTCHGCEARCSLVVKTREGRPIKIEGNPQSPLSRGAACAVGQATVLGLYDNARLTGPAFDKKVIEGKESWATIDKEIGDKLKQIASAGGQIRLLTGTINSPTGLNVIKEFISKYPTTQHVQYDAVSVFALRAAHQANFGKAVIPHYKIDNAKMLVSFGADFLGTWISPVEFTKTYSEAHKAEGKNHLYHVQFESNLSLSGANADMRAVLAPSQYGAALIRLHNYIAGMTGSSSIGNSNLELMGNALQATAKQLVKNRGAAIVMTDSNDIDHQMIVAAINKMLGSYGSTMDIDNPSYQGLGDDKAMIQLVEDMNAGRIAALITGSNCNPAYTYPDAAKFEQGLKKTKLSVSFSDRFDETATLSQFIAPDSHFLESWGDDQPYKGYVTLRQPTISNILNTRQWEESLLRWSDNPISIADYVQNFWNSKEGNWEQHLHDGFILTNNEYITPGSINVSYNLADSASRASKVSGAGNQVELVLYEKVSIRDGRHANNPWLQELPDPISKVTWDNYICVNPKWADENKLNDEDVVTVKAGNYSVDLPIYRVPGMRIGTAAIAVGYGRKGGKKAGRVIAQTGGANVYPFAKITADTILYKSAVVEITKKGGTYPLAMTQTHHHMEGRDIVRETTLSDYLKTPEGEKVGAPDELKGKGHHLISLWQDYRFPGHHWGMAVDLNACTGCGACVVACTAENNVPVVGKDEVRRRREMHWMRIDRYFAIGEVQPGAKREEYIEEYKKINDGVAKGEIDFENVRTVFQPMLCQHCNNAPCETVCPVNAISHSSEGINQQVYNRCVGTRYCANNCPYKVRRFNWYDYAENDHFPFNMYTDMGRMVLNPDVTVRIRGVMEKCSFCVQRTQLAKLEAKTEGRQIKDGEVRTACMQTCPANAIVFGDMNDPNSEVSKLFENNRTYSILPELNTRPNVSYMARIRNIPTDETV